MLDSSCHTGVSSAWFIKHEFFLLLFILDFFFFFFSIDFRCGFCVYCFLFPFSNSGFCK